MFPWQHRDPRQELYQHLMYQSLVEGLRQNNGRHSPWLDDYSDDMYDLDDSGMQEEHDGDATEGRWTGSQDAQSGIRFNRRGEHPEPIKLDGEFAWGSSEGRKYREEAEHRKNGGNEALKNKDYFIAIDLYTAAMEAAFKVCNNEEQMAVLFSNRSHTYLQIRDYEHATTDAAFCVQLKPGWYKGALRLLAARKGAGENVKAIAMGIEIMSRFDVPSTECRLKVFQDVLVLAEQTQDGYKQLKEFEVSTSEEMWTKLLQNLYKAGHWHIIHILINGNDDTGPLMTSYKATGVNLAGLLQKCKPTDWTSWGEKLAQTLIEKGTPRQSLDPDNKYPLHAALNVGIRTGSYGLLEYLFRYIPTADRDRRDDEGNTLLHAACRGKFDTKEHCIQLLLDSNLDPTRMNNAGELPISLLSPGDSSCIVLRDAMAEKGFDISSLTSHVLEPSGDKQEHNIPPATGTDTSVRPRLVTSHNPNIPFMARDRTPQSFDAYQWSPIQVKKWLDGKQLGFAERSVAGAGGPQLVELRMMLETSPKYFYSSLREQMTGSRIHMLRLGNALREIV